MVRVEKQVEGSGGCGKGETRGWINTQLLSWEGVAARKVG